MLDALGGTMFQKILGIKRADATGPKAFAIIVHFKVQTGPSGPKA